jgi:CelD/BcsL family acetyltransferase involved in cellulose biosynthesis
LFKTVEGRLPGLTGLLDGTAENDADIIDRPLPLGATLSVISSLDQLLAVSHAWRSLEADGGRSHNVFQSYAWAAAWASVYAEPNGDAKLHVVTGHRGSRMVFLLPLMLCRRGPVRMLQWLSEPFGQYGDILVAPGEDARAWMRAAVKQIQVEGTADVIRLRHVRQDAAAFPYLRHDFRSARNPDGAPFMDLRQFATDEAYEQRYSKDQRKRRKKIRKELEELGPVTFTLLDHGKALDDAIEQAVEQKRQWLRERRLFSRAMACPKISEFLKELARHGDPQSRIVTSVMAVGNKPVSWEVGLRFKDRHHGFITAHDVRLTDKSPARLHMDQSQRQALADGLSIFDLMVPNDPHKESWSSAVVGTGDHYRSLSLLGWVYGRFYLETLRPLLRHAYYNSSAQFRDALCRLGKSKAFFMH